MGYKIGVVTLGSTGLKSINLGTPSTPTAVTFIVQNKTGTAESTKHVSIGSYDSTNGQRCTSYVKPSGGSSSPFNVTNKVVSHYEDGPTEVLAAEFDSFLSNGVKINVLTADTDYDVYVRVDY